MPKKNKKKSKINKNKSINSPETDEEFEKPLILLKQSEKRPDQDRESETLKQEKMLGQAQESETLKQEKMLDQAQESKTLEQAENKLEQPGKVLEHVRTTLDQPQEGITNMFASVWVKIEVEENDETAEDNNLGSVANAVTDEGTQKPPATKRKRNPPLTTLHCELCDYTTKHKSCLKTHILDHAMLKPYPCPYCDYATKFRPSFIRHIQMKHEEKMDEHNIKIENYNCEFCDYTTTFKWNLKMHKRRHKADKDYKCSECDYQSSYRHNFLKHCRRHKNKQINEKNDKEPKRELYKCDKCSFETKFEGHIQRHLAKIHHEILESAHNCGLCDFSTRYNWRLNIHKQRSKQEEIIKCTYCDFETFFNCQFKKHREMHYVQIYGGSKKKYKVKNVEPASMNTGENHSEQNDQQMVQNVHQNVQIEQQNVQSDQQNVQTVQQMEQSDQQMVQNLIDNIQQFDNEKHDEFNDKFKCTKCHFETKFEGHISRHLTKIHNIILDQKFNCSFCDYSTKLKTRLNVHLRNSKHEEIIKCPHCPFQTNYSCQIKKHGAIHFNEIFGTRQLLRYNNADVPTYPNMADNQPLYNIVPQDLPHIPIPQNPQIPYVETQNTQNQYIENSTQWNDKGRNKYKIDAHSIDWHSIQVLESDNKDKPFQCHMCPYTSKFKASVQRHFQRMHTSQTRPYKCINCDFSTKTIEQISLHNKRSQSETILTCKICQFTTFFKCQFVTHQRSHYINKCSVCSYSARHKYELIKHYSTFHLGNGLKCKYCEYRATRKESLLCHEAIHTGEKPFKCDLCDYKTVRHSLLEIHKRRHHMFQTDVTVISSDKIKALKVVNVDDDDRFMSDSEVLSKLNTICSNMVNGEFSNQFNVNTHVEGAGTNCTQNSVGIDTQPALGQSES